MTDQTPYLFVYGTLRKGFSLPINKRIAGDIKWIGYSQIQGKLYDIGGYPGAIQEKSDFSFVIGEIIFLKDPGATLQLLDEYEGFDPGNERASEYCRKKECFELADGSKIEAWIYWYNFPVEAKQGIRGNDYLKFLQKNQLA